MRPDFLPAPSSRTLAAILIAGACWRGSHPAQAAPRPAEAAGPVAVLNPTPAALAEPATPAKATARNAPAPAPAPTTAPTPDAQRDAAWTVVLAAFRGTDALAQAQAALPKVRAVAGLEDAFLTQRGPAVFIGLGRFADPAEPDAQALLQRVRAIDVQGERPFAQSFFAPPQRPAPAGAPPGAGGAAGRPEFNLANARQQFGPRAELTLQVGVYGRDDLERPTDADLAESRALAEAAVQTLRREGELAFYYHGPRRSMVTVGIFSERDLKDQHPGIDRLKRLFPHNLYNGQGVRLRRGTPAPGGGPDQPAAPGAPAKGDGELQQSMLVRIPRT